MKIKQSLLIVIIALSMASCQHNIMDTEIKTDLDIIDEHSMAKNAAGFSSYTVLEKDQIYFYNRFKKKWYLYPFNFRS